MFIEGYPSSWSLEAGDALQLHVSTNAPTFSLEIVRIGATREVVFTEKEIKGTAYPIPEDASSQGCNWPSAYTLKISPEWKSGYYQIRFKAEDGGGKFTHRNKRSAESTGFFIIRAAQPGKTSKILLQLATNTYNAYNNWGGYSVYSYHGRDNVQGRRVSQLRPQSSLFENWEKQFVEWAEKNGFTLEFAANNDLQYRPELLKHYKLVLSVGHDEYWSASMRDHLEEFIERGGNVAFFSGNTCCWQIRNESGGSAYTCFKQSWREDPYYLSKDMKLLSSLWSHHLIERPENQLTGVGFLWGGYHRSHGQFMEGSGAFTIHRPDHWILEGTELKRGDEFGGADTIVGYECDGCEIEWREGAPYPTSRDGTPKNFEILATAPAKWEMADSDWYDQWEKGRTGNAVLGTYTRGGTVVTVGTTDWSHGLRGNDPKVTRITTNILKRLGE